MKQELVKPGDPQSKEMLKTALDGLDELLGLLAKDARDAAANPRYLGLFPFLVGPSFLILFQENVH